MKSHRFDERSNPIYYLSLNEGWEKGDGGESKIFKGDDELIIEQITRRYVMFKSADVPHEVMITNVGRYSLTSWNRVGWGLFWGDKK